MVVMEDINKSRDTATNLIQSAADMATGASQVETEIMIIFVRIPISLLSIAIDRLHLTNGPSGH